MTAVDPTTGEVLDDFSEKLRSSLEVVKPTDSGLVLTADQWADRIRAHLGEAVEGILGAGRDLVASKQQLGHGRFTRMVEERLPFSVRTGQMLMAIAGHGTLSNANHGSLLPPSWRTLYELSRLPTDVVEEALQSGVIRADLERQEAHELVLRYVPAKPQRARTIKVGDLVQDDQGDEREVTAVETNDDLVVLHTETDEDDDALILGADQEVKVRGITKPDLGGGLAHPAPFSDALLPVFAEVLEGCTTILDPFAGTGKIHRLQEHGFKTTGIELEPEWAELHPDTVVGNALILDYEDGTFDAICTSPTYGNRLADHHNASDPETRRSYTHDLGRTLSEGSSGAMQWGHEYRAFHEDAWDEAVRVLRPGGRFVLNIKDHIRDGKRQRVSMWHLQALEALGLQLADIVPVPTPSMRAGENATARVPGELVIVMEKPE